MIEKSETILSICRDADIILARAKGEELALTIGMDKDQVTDIAIAISELASNLIKHRVIEGKIIIREIGREGRKGIEVISSDLGPGIADVGKAMTDGYSTAASLGIGLPAVNRLMDEFEIRSNIGEGTLVTTRKWEKPESSYMSVQGLELSVFSRPLPGQRYNGDSYFIKRYEDKVIFAVIDGLGHGKYAQEASQSAVDCLENSYRRPFTEIFQLCHQRLKKTRGAAMSLCCINLKDRVMTHTGIGNVQTRVYSSEATPAPFCINGTLGVAMPRVKVDDYPLPQNYLTIMFSDGISGRFSLDNFPGFLSLKAQRLAKQIMDNHSRDNDDATVIVSRSR
jgi:anti-sigma regulatory factor (Ser/Thr protein kinase)/serine/threonine protein phosphatase PrpC